MILIWKSILHKTFQMKTMNNNALLAFLFVCTFLLQGYGQKDPSKHQRLVEMKLNFIIEKTELDEAEKEAFNAIFTQYEARFHQEVWLPSRKIRNSIRAEIDTISVKSASDYISRFSEYEKLGLELKQSRNEQLLEKIRPTKVLYILYQEKRFDREMIERIRNKNNPKGKKD